MHSLKVILADAETDLTTAKEALSTSQKAGPTQIVAAAISLVASINHRIAALATHHKPAISRQLSYKKLSVESTCRKYLDMLSRNISKYYAFDYKYSSPTIGDVLHAKNGSCYF